MSDSSCTLSVGDLDLSNRTRDEHGNDSWNLCEHLIFGEQCVRDLSRYWHAARWASGYSRASPTRHGSIPVRFVQTELQSQRIVMQWVCRARQHHRSGWFYQLKRSLTSPISRVIPLLCGWQMMAPMSDNSRSEAPMHTVCEDDRNGGSSRW